MITIVLYSFAVLTEYNLSKGLITWRVFSPVKQAEIASRLHEQFEPGMSLVRAIFIAGMDLLEGGCPP